MKISIGCFFTLAMFMFSCGSEPEAEQFLRTVRHQPAYASNGIRIRSFSGMTQPGVESKLSFRVSGAIDILPVHVGDHVEAGDTIAQIDDTEYNLRVQELEASLLQTKAQERHAAANYARIRELYETYSTSRNDLDASRAESESASAGVEAMQKRLALARSQLSYTSLKAPLNGSIAIVNAEVNENVNSGQPIVVLNSGRSIEVKVSIPEILIQEIEKDEKVSVTFHSQPGKFFEGTVSEVGVSSEGGATFPVTVQLLETPADIRYGMAAEVTFRFPDDEYGVSIYIPASSVFGKGRQRHVFVVKPIDNEVGTVEKRVVTVGTLRNAGIEITSGIADGEWIVTAGIHSLNDGQQVKLYPNKSKNRHLGNAKAPVIGRSQVGQY